jgi:hypothetical protein
VKIKSLVIVCKDDGTAEALVGEYEHIGRLAIRRGRFVTVTTGTTGW